MARKVKPRTDSDAGKVLSAMRLVRWHQTPVLHRETLLEHHGMTAQILLLIDPMPRAALLAVAVTHDIGEAKTGDIASPVKDNLGIRHTLDRVEATANPFSGCRYKLSKDEQILLHIVDTMARAAYLLFEVSMGNSLVKPKLEKAIADSTALIESSIHKKKAMKVLAEILEYFPLKYAQEAI